MARGDRGHRRGDALRVSPRHLLAPTSGGASTSRATRRDRCARCSAPLRRSRSSRSTGCCAPLRPTSRCPAARRSSGCARSSPRAGRTQAHLALLGDKYLLLHEGGARLRDVRRRRPRLDRDGRSGRSARRAPRAGLALPRARRRARRSRVVLRGRRRATCPVYLDLGLTLRKLGEEARVSLADFSIDGPRHAKLRHARNRMTREGCHFEVLPADEVSAAARRSGGDLGCLARPQEHPGEALLARLLRSCVSRAHAARGVAPRASASSPSRTSGRAAIEGGAVDRPDALRRGRAAVVDGRALRRVDAVGPRAGIPLVLARHGAALGLRAPPPRAALESARRPALPLRRALLQLPGPARVEGEVRSGVGAALPRGAEQLWRCPSC